MKMHYFTKQEAEKIVNHFSKSIGKSLISELGKEPEILVNIEAAKMTHQIAPQGNIQYGYDVIFQFQSKRVNQFNICKLNNLTPTPAKWESIN